MVRRTPLQSALFAFAFVLSLPALAESPADPRRATVVAHVGATTISVGDLEDRMAQVPPYQLASFGDTAEKRARKFLDDVMIPDALLSQGAAARHLDKSLSTAYLLEHARADAAVRGIKRTVPAASQIALDDIKKYYEENRAKYDAPERYNVWRILATTRAEALAILADARKDGSLAHWNTLARDKSIDKTSYMRGGNLGFVTAEGRSSEAGLGADPTVVQAAMKVKDGEFVPEPIPEGPNFAVVWRRGTVGASHRSLQEVEAQIRDTLFKQRSDAEVKRVTEDARKRLVRDHNPALLEQIDVSTAAGQIVARKRPGQVAPVTSAK